MQVTRSGKVLGAKRGARASPIAVATPSPSVASDSASKASGYLSRDSVLGPPSPPPLMEEAVGERARIVLRVRPPLTEEEAGDSDSAALQLDAAQGLAWAFGDTSGASEVAPRQFAFDELLEAHAGQADVYEAAGQPAVRTALSGGVGAVLLFGARGSGKRHTLLSDAPGQEGLLERALAQIFVGTSGSAPSRPARMPSPSDAAAAAGAAGGREAEVEVRVAYLTITRDQTVRDLSTAALVLPPQSRPGAALEAARWERAATLLDVKRVLKLGDANRPAEASEPQAGCHTILALKLGERGLLLFASLAASDMVGPPASAEGGGEAELFSRRSPLAASFSALGRCLEAMASDGESAPPVMDCALTATLAQALGAVPNAFTTLLLTAHPHRQKLPLTTHAMTFGQLGVSSVARARLGAGIDYASLAAQLMAQRDSKQEALYSMEKRVLAELRPELEGVMRVEGDIRALMARLHSMQWEASMYADKEAQLQRQMEEQRAEHHDRIGALRAETAAVVEELNAAMGTMKGSRELAAMRLEHEQDTQALGARLKALQAEVEAAEGEVAANEKRSVDAKAVMPSVSRQLATQALRFAEDAQQAEAAKLFALALSTLECAFGSSHPHLAAFKVEVQQAIDGAAGVGGPSIANGVGVDGSATQRGLYDA